MFKYTQTFSPWGFPYFIKVNEMNFLLERKIAQQTLANLEAMLLLVLSESVVKILIPGHSPVWTAKYRPVPLTFVDIPAYFL